MTQTERALRQAYRDSGLWALGYTYAQAISNPALAMGLANIVDARMETVRAPHPQLELEGIDHAASRPRHDH